MDAFEKIKETLEKTIGGSYDSYLQLKEFVDVLANNQEFPKVNKEVLLELIDCEERKKSINELEKEKLIEFINKKY